MKPVTSNWLLMFLFIVISNPSAAEEHKFVFGKAGLEHVALLFTNAGPEPLSCKSSVAHWFSVDLGVALKGKAVAAELWADPKTGEVFFLNAQVARMPVQALWCGLEGRSWETRFEFSLDRRIGTAPPSIQFLCTQSTDKVLCRPD